MDLCKFIQGNSKDFTKIDKLNKEKKNMTQKNKIYEHKILKICTY